MVAGHLREQNGYFQMILSWKSKDGKRKSKSISTGLPIKGNKKRAEAMLAQTRNEFNPGDMTQNTDIPCDEILFSDFILQWLEIQRSRVELTTYCGYANSIKGQIVPYFKRYTLKDLEKCPQLIQEFYTHELARGVSPNTVIHRHANIRKCLQYAFRIGLIASNPADRIERPKKTRYSATIYNMQELDILFKTLKEESDPLELAVILAAFYGLRRSEAVGLKWESIDFERKTITIKHTVTQANLDGKCIMVHKDRPKNKSSFRSLPLVPPFEDLLKRLRAEQELNRKVCGKSYSSDYLEYIYVNPIGELIKPDFITQHFDLFLKKHELKKIRFHDLRHSCATLLYANGVRMKEIQEWLGHSNIKTTSDTYTHMDYSSKISSANAIIQLYPVASGQ